MNKVVIDFERCKQCGYCMHFCPKGVLVQGDTINKFGYFPPTTDPDKECIGCATCARVCPDTAISIYKDVE